MREIKFRAWDDGKKEWLLGYELKNLGGFSLFGECMMLGEWSHILDQFLFKRNGHKQDDLKVMQFIGLKDKNGKEVFESDLIRATPSDYAPHEIYEVKWHEKELRWEIPIPIGDYVVIGNRYENPELLK